MVETTEIVKIRLDETATDDDFRCAYHLLGADEWDTKWFNFIHAGEIQFEGDEVKKCTARFRQNMINDLKSRGISFIERKVYGTEGSFSKLI